MNYESVMWVLTVAVAAVLVLIALTNVFAQVVKKLINREKYPAFVLVPQCPAGSYWAYTERPKSLFPADMPAGQEMSSLTRTLKQLLDTYLAMPEVDKKRIYIVGLSMGAMGTYDWWSVIRRFLRLPFPFADR